MPETFEAVQALRSEMRAGFEATGLRVGMLENELHRHQDEDRSDMSAIRADVRIVGTKQANIDGAVAAIKYVVGIPAFIAAIGTVISLIRHW